MIPILFESTETEFDNNGLGRLYDCIACEVVEERNGVYECNFSMPVTGSHFDDIILGRIIAVRHDNTGDVQPFDIVSYSRPIDGIVAFHAVHISYRLSKIVTKKSGPINSLSSALNVFSTAIPSMPFSFSTDKSSTGYVSCFDGIPKSVKSCLGGIEGSILDAYGGEYEFNKFNVTLWNARGVERDITIRYGLNMTDYAEDTDYTESCNACVAYWTGEDAYGNTITVSTGLIETLTSYNGRTEVLPLDLSDKFEEAPTVAQLTAAAQSYMSSNQVNLPSQNIRIDFLNLRDTVEYRNYAKLWTCNLCDTVNVVFPKYGLEGKFKIVKIVYDVLQGRCTSMELGNLSTTLSEALGLSSESVASDDTKPRFIQKRTQYETVAYITSSKTTLWFSYTLPFNIPTSATVTINTLSVTLRGLALNTNNVTIAVYVGPTSSTDTGLRSLVSSGTLDSNLSSVTIEVTTPNVITFFIKHSNVWLASSGTLMNNSPVACRIGAMDLSFDY